MAFDRLQASPGRKPRSLDRLPPMTCYVARPAYDAEIPELAELVEKHIPGITNACENARRVYRHSSESIFVVYRDERIVGGVASLYLNQKGLDRLLSGALSFERPEIDCLTPSGGEVVAIYAWALCLPAASPALGNVMQWLQRPLYRQADIFARPGTIGGMRFMRDTGFVACAFRTPDLWVYRRRPRSNFEYLNLPDLEENDPLAPAVKSVDGDESRAQEVIPRN